jgi:hypothetical protein
VHRLAHDGALLGEVLRTFMEHLNTFYRDQARGLGYDDGRPGGATFVQRFGSSLNLNIHAHVLMLEGVGLPARPPPIAAARPHPQPQFDYAAG